MASRINKLISDFLTHLKAAGRSELTLRNYELYLERFLEFSENPLPSEVNEALIKEYQEWLKNLSEKSRLIKIEKNLKKNTINYHLTALRSFLKYLSEQGVETLAPEKVELEKMPKRRIDFLSEREIEQLLEAPLKTEVDEIIKFRDKAILEILFSTGARVSEFTNLKRGNIENDKVVIRGSKGKERRLTLTNQARHYLNKYLGLRSDKLLALFVGHDRAAKARKMKKLVPTSNLTARSIQRIVKKYALMAGVGKKITPQILRNSVAVRMLESGKDEREVSTILGYESISTTNKYKML